MMTSLVSVRVADSASTWERLGFVVDADGAVVISGVQFRFEAEHGERGPGTRAKGLTGKGAKGLTGWTLHDRAGVLPENIDGISTTTVATHDPVAAHRTNGSHPNGVTGIDHLVLRTPNLERTIATFERLGFACRRRRDAHTQGSTITQQAFFWLGSPDDPNDRVVLEVVGSSVVDPDKTDAPSSFFGIALVCNDLDVTAAFFGDLVKPPIDAVQPGRRITAISARGGSTVPIALMTPHVK